MWQVKVRLKDGHVTTFRAVTDHEGAVSIALMLHGQGEECSLVSPSGKLYLV